MIETSKSCHFPTSVPAVWLVDNGSLRAESVLALREQAVGVAQISGVSVQAVSVLHSSKVPAEQLGGVSAATFTPYLRACAQGGLRRLLVLPYFFGPSAALTEYLPQQIARVQEEFPHLDVRIAPPLVDLADPLDDAAEILADALAQGVDALWDGAVCAGEAAPAVVLVDHGSPQPGVSAVRARVGEALHKRLSGKIRAFGVCSMEAREGAEYAHTLPLLEQVLAQEPFCWGKVIVAPLFLSPGRHAGEEGDLWQIAEGVRAVHPSLHVVFCPLVGGGPATTEILLKRLHAGLDAFA